MNDSNHPLPAGYVARPPAMEDVEAVVDVENRRSNADIGEGDMSVARLRMFWQEPGRDISENTRVVEDPAGRVIAYGDFYEDDTGNEHELAFVVDPDHKGRGIERWLIDWGVVRAEHIPAKDSGETPTILDTQIWASNTEDQHVLAEAGFELDRVWNRMLIEMDRAPDCGEDPPGISIRTLQPDELNHIHEVWSDAQRDEYGFYALSADQFQYFLVDQEENFDPTLWFLAIDNTTGEIAGYCLCRWERPGEPETGQIRYLAVRRQYRRRGIASALLRHTFTEFYRRGKRKVGLAVDSASLTRADRVYERAGMRTAHQGLVFRKVIRKSAVTQ